MKDLIDSIVEGLNAKYKGKLDCEEQRADLFVYVNGNEEAIKAVDIEMIYFEDETLNVKLLDADVHSLVYIDHIINQ
jgi:hypothetical protein